MSKAINWPEEFYNEILSESINEPKIALRLGSLYFDHGYYTDGDLIDIRVNHKIAREAKIIGDMKLMKIKDLSSDLLSMYKNRLKQKNEIINFLEKNYNKPVNEETDITVITYSYLPFREDEEIDDPHL